MVGEGISDNMALSKNLKEVGEGDTGGSWEKNVPGRGNNKGQDLEAEWK